MYQMDIIKIKIMSNVQIADIENRPRLLIVDIWIKYQNYFYLIPHPPIMTTNVD